MGLADFVVPRSRLAELAGRLRDEEPGTVLHDLHDPAVAPPPQFPAERGWIDTCYGSDDPSKVLTYLRSHPARETNAAADVLASVALTAAAVTLTAVRRAGQMADMRECLRQDYRLNSRFLEHPDLVEGIPAKVIDRDGRPRWMPASIAEVEAATVAAFFEPFADPTDELEPQVSCS